MKTTLKRLATQMISNPVLFPFTSVLIVVLFTSVILLISSVDPLAAYREIFLGSLSSWTRLAHVLKAWIPLTLCAVGLLYTFRINLWNIGVEGQMIMGGICAMAAIRFFTETAHPGMVLFASFLFAAAGGSLWAYLAGLLKFKGGVNEIFAGLGLNFVAQGIILWLIFGPWKRPGVASMSGTEIIRHDLWLSVLPHTSLSYLGLVLAVMALVISFFVLRYTQFGLGLKAIGLNPRASFLYGLKPIRYMTLAMILGGGLAGLAGGFQVTGVYHRLIPAISSNYGYLALLVVMLANNDIRITPFISFFFACLNVGSIQLPMVLQLDSSLSGVIQGCLVITFLALNSLRRFFLIRREVAHP